MADITMPQLGETVTEGTITRWLKGVGDEVAEDELLFEVSTDKVDSEVPSPSAGYLSEILVPEGETVDVGTRLAVISSQAPAGGSQNGASDAAAPSADEGQAAPAPETSEAPAEAPVAVEDEAGPPPSEPAQADAPAQASAPVQAGAAATVAEAGGTTEGGAASGKVLSPVVRRLIADYHIDPAQLQGTGPGGRITRADVLGFIDRQSGNGVAATSGAPAAAPAASAAATPAAAPPAAPPPAPPAAGGPTVTPAPAAPALVAGERDTVVPFTNIRRRTAEHMVRSKQTSAHTMVAVEVDYSAVEKVRSAAKAHFKEQEGFGLTYLPFISRAVIDALGDWPHVNSSVGDDELLVHNYVNLGIAVDLNFEGLLVPVIHDADGKRLRQLAREISGLAGKARAKRVTMDDISGGTFTITNAGQYGTLITVPVINQPQVAILSTDGVRKRPVVVELPDGSDAIAIHPVGNLVMSWDHRAFDGAYAAAFIAAVKEILETRDWAPEL